MSVPTSPQGSGGEHIPADTLNNPKLIMFYGAGSGAGKSTLSRAIWQRLKDVRMTGGHHAEEEVLTSEAFAPYVSAVDAGDGSDMDTLWFSCLAFLAISRNSPGVIVTDSILPCTDWLVSAGVETEAVVRFAQNLADQMDDIPSLFVFVERDVRVAMERAIADRGGEWARELAIKRCGSDDLDGLIAYLSRAQVLGLLIWDRWPHPKIKIVTTHDSPESCEAQISSALGLG